MADVVMPRLSDSMEEGTILQWLKQVGEEVALGEELVEIETDKANMAYESDVAGTLTEIVVEVDETVPIGTVIARVGDSGEGSGASAAGPVAEDVPPAHPPEGPPSAPPAGEGSDAPETPTPPTSTEADREEAEVGRAPPTTSPAGGGEAEDGERVKASPLARRLAGEKGVELGGLEGSGPGGRILKSDVERASSAGGAGDGEVEDVPARSASPSPGTGPAVSPPEPTHPSPVPGPAATTPEPSPPPVANAVVETAKGEVTIEEPSKLQATVARRMAESKATAPHFYLEAGVDMSRAVEGRGWLKAGAGEGDVVPSFNDMVVKACAMALREHPRANGAYRDGRFELYSRVNVGVAVAARDALVVPTVFDADLKSLRQIATESRALARRVREGQITPPELSGATFTVSNLGMYGIDIFAAVINPPQAAILAVGAIAERPVIRDGEPSSAHLMRVNLACDHRILYGAGGAQFLARVRELLEEPLHLTT